MRALLLWIIEGNFVFLHTWRKISVAEVHSLEGAKA